MSLAEVPAESPSIDILYEIAHENGKVIELSGHTSCPVIKLSESQEDFLMGISRNERHNLRRNNKRLEKLGYEVEYYHASLSSDVQKEMDTFVKLHQMRWEQKDLGGCFKNQQFLDFHKEVLHIFSERGWTSLDFLVVNGEKVAGIYSYTYDGIYYLYLPGLNPAILPKASLGRLLLFQCISQAIEEGYEEVDLLQGASDYKMGLANKLRRSVIVRFYNKTIRAALSKGIENGKEVIKVLVR